MLRDHLLREREGLSELVNRSRSAGQFDDHGAASGVGKRGEG
jgi:hypothetical protein